MAVPVRDKEFPAHNDVEETPAVTDTGLVLFIITVELAACVVPQPLIALNVYTPAIAVVTLDITGLWIVELNPFGPSQLQLVALVAVPVRVNEFPAHNDVEETPAVTDTGLAVLIITAELFAAVVPQPLIALNV